MSRRCLFNLTTAGLADPGAAFVKKPDIIASGADIVFFIDNIKELSFISSFGVLPEVDVSPGARARGVRRYSMRISSIMRS